MKLNKKTVIWIVAILGAITLVIIVVQWQRRLNQKSMAESVANAAAAEAAAQTQLVAASEQCSQNWFCATSSILGSVGGMVGSFYGGGSGY